MSPLFSSLLLLTGSSLLLWLIRPHRFRHIGWIAAVPPAIVTGWLLTQLPVIASGQVVTATISWAPTLGLELALRLDGLSLFFGLIIAGIGTGVALYTGYYFEHERRLGFFYGQIFLFMACMLGLVWADNLLVLFVFWEGTSITSYLLIAFKDTDKSAQDGGRRAFLVTGLGGLAMLFGMIMLGASAGSYTISEMLATPGLASGAWAPVAMTLIFLGAFTKSAQFPFHFWLPGAMSAPTPASAYLHSATMVKAGVFLLARLHPALSEHPYWFWALFIVGGATMLVGAIGAMGHYDMKALLAFATVSQLGILVLILAFDSSIAYKAAVVGILAHSLYKGPLFLLAGIIDHATGTRDLRRFAGLGRELPLVAGVGVLAGISMAGFPPTFGFLAKETLLDLFYQAIEAGMPLVGWIGLGTSAVAGAFFVAYSVTLIWETFFRAKASVGEAAHVHHAPSFSFVLPPLLLTVIGTIIPFVLTQVQDILFAPAAGSIAGEPVAVKLALWHGFNLVLMVSLAAIAVGILIFVARGPLRRVLDLWPDNITGVKLFDKFIYAIYDLANWATRQVQGGTLAQQAGIMLIVGVIVVATALTRAQWPADFPIRWGDWPEFSEAVLAVLAIVAAILTVRAQTRLSAIISIGIVGIAVTLFFVFHSAPDLALTQLLVDILTVVLLVLVFYRIPPQQLPPIRTGARVRNLIVSVATGLLAFTLVLFTTGDPFFPPISDYFSLNAVALGHGANVVNVILVDFRGFDTFGEIAVLVIAAVGGYAVLRSALYRLRPPATTHAAANGTAATRGANPVKEGDHA